jgi:hypothetical protein
VSDSWPPPQHPDEAGPAPSGEGASAQPPPPGRPAAGPPEYGQPPQGEPASAGPDQYGQPPYGQPAYGQPPYGAPPAPGQPDHVPPASGGPQYGQPPPPPYGDEATRPYGPPPYGGSFGQTPQSAYPQQELLPHDVKPSRSRVPLVIGLVVALALVGGGIAAWLLLRDNGESTRAQYCTTIKNATHGGDISTILQGGPQEAMAGLHKLVTLAPDVVADDWKTLTNLLESAQRSQSRPSITDYISGLGALRSIATDSNAHCGTTIPVPSVP